MSSKSKKKNVKKILNANSYVLQREQYEEHPGIFSWFSFFLILKFALKLLSIFFFLYITPSSSVIYSCQVSWGENIVLKCGTKGSFIRENYDKNQRLDVKIKQIQVRNKTRIFAVVGVNHWNYLEGEMDYCLPLNISNSVLDVFLKGMVQSELFITDLTPGVIGYIVQLETYAKTD